MLYTLVITSCGRHDLLKRTLESFRMCVDQGPRETLIIEDSAAERPEWLPRHNVRWISNGSQRGQIFSIDKVYSEVKTPYIFHCEDDWQFHDTGFAEKSLEILEKHPEILQVSLREDNWHPTVKYEEYPFGIMQPDWREGWSGFSFNPGMRRLSDYERIGSYGRHTGYDPNFDASSELQLSKLYRSLGYYAASLPRHCYHIGAERHATRRGKPLPKILIAVPTAPSLDYAAFRERQKKVYGEKLVQKYPNGITGLQVDGPNVRQEAVRETWFRDAAVHSNVTVKFFDGKTCGCADDHMHVVHKTRYALRWALDNGFDYFFKCDDDTFVHVDRLVRQAIELTADYAGVEQAGFAVGGPGFWLSRKAMQQVLDAPLPDVQDYCREDWWIGELMKAAGIRVTELPGLTISGETGMPGQMVTLHPVSPEKMKELYEYSGIHQSICGIDA